MQYLLLFRGKKKKRLLERASVLRLYVHWPSSSYVAGILVAIPHIQPGVYIVYQLHHSHIRRKYYISYLDFIKLQLIAACGQHISIQNRIKYSNLLIVGLH